MTAVQSLEEMVAAAPIYENESTPDFSGIHEAFSAVGVNLADVVAVSQCQFGKANIEALVDDDTIAFVHPAGVLCTSGKRKLMGKAVKYGEVKFGQCRGFAPCEYTDDRGFGKFGIEFGGAGDVLLGRVTGDGRPNALGTRLRRPWRLPKSAIVSSVLSKDCLASND